MLMQAMERRYTALAEQQGTLAAEKEKLSSEKQALMEVIAVHLQACKLPGPNRRQKDSVHVSSRRDKDLCCAGPESLQDREHQSAGRSV